MLGATAKRLGAQSSSLGANPCTGLVLTLGVPRF